MEKSSRKMHVAMFPWFAFGHIIPFLHLSNELAERGHTVTFFLPRKALSKLRDYLKNPHPHHHLITFCPLIVPPVDGLPPETETASDIPRSLTPLLGIAFDRTSDQLEAALRSLSPSPPDVLLYDFAHWAPELASRLGIKSVHYSSACPAVTAYSCFLDEAPLQLGGEAAPAPAPVPPGYPSSTVVLRAHELRLMGFIYAPDREGLAFRQRVTAARTRCDAISIKTCREIDGPICDYLARQFGKPVFLTGPVLPKPPAPADPLLTEDRWEKWLGGFKPGSVIFCAFGSENITGKEQFQEILLGLELTGLPFLAVVRPPTGSATVEEALPEEFSERVGGRGVVHGGWVPQLQILNHPSVGCFVSHGGYGSMWESLIADPQIVLLPEHVDHILNARLLAAELKVAVEVEKEPGSGLFSKESLSDAIKTVMDEEGEVGGRVKKNHAKWKETLLGPGFMTNYVDNFVDQLQGLLLASNLING